ncbi:enoyl-CoA hydratase/isomerase family protein [Natronobeatus ordinarius]|uniref:enoyl-CoA hydratase/isomerase family protein n=1 Tax=Natronobeatus ordinarius TaxID=2963433 RepID=UPI0020CC3D53|nr:enoyl-CoA hydratase-related protein [Natronobeatus ordinarius]
MRYETITIDHDGYVATITLDRPGSMNTFSTQLALDLDDALEALEANDDVRVIVVEGAGDAFSAGIDLTEHGAHEGAAEYETWVSRMEEPFRTLVGMTTPVIASAHGFAAANGLGLVAACDLAVLAEGTKLGATAPKVGLFCMGPAVPIMNSVTEKRCLELLLTGELIDAETAVEWGLANRVVPEDRRREATMDLAESIAEKSPVAVQRGKRAYYEMADMGYEEALEYSNERFAALCVTDDAAEGIEAFLEGREPEWPGR